MVERRVAQPAGLQLSSLAQPHIIEIAKSPSGQPAIVRLDDGQGNGPDLAAVAQKSARPAVLLGDQSAADPFFDFSGKPISHVSVAFGGGIDGELDLLVPNTVGQSAQTDDDKILSSGVDFRAPSVDALPGSAHPLGLLGSEGQARVGNPLADSDTGAGLHRNFNTSSVVGSAPGGVIIPGPGGAGTQVFEAGLGPRSGEPAGTHAGQPSFPTTTKVGTISFTSPDGVQRIELGGLVLSVVGTPQTFTDATGTLTASFTYNAATGQGTISYSYTLLDNTLADPSSMNFAVAVTDRDGDRTTGGNLAITIVDDAPVAVADTDSVAAGQLTAETGNVLTGAGTTSGSADVRGADGAVVAGVAVGDTGSNLVNAGTVGAAIAGAFGTLKLNADGSYNYVHTGAAGGGTDVFTYTIRDADGDASHATLTIAVADSSPGGITIPTAGGAATTVFEAGLPSRGTEPAGSHTGDAAFPATASGTISFTSPDGVQRVELGSLVLTTAGTQQSFTDATGRLTASYTYDVATGQGTISYSYTLLDNTLVGAPSPSFAVAVTDTDGDRTVGGNLVISVADDAPVAVADTDSVAAGQTAPETGNVLTGAGTTSAASGVDVQGADGALQVVGVAAGSGAGGAAPGTVGSGIVGAFGTLTLNADGSYSYVHTAGGGTDVFTYTIRDADGSLSHTTLNIAVADSSPGGITVPAAGGAATTVFEAGLGARGSEPAGSHTGDPTFPVTTQSGTITFFSLRVASGRRTLHSSVHSRMLSLNCPLMILRCSGRSKARSNASAPTPLPTRGRSAAKRARPSTG